MVIFVILIGLALLFGKLADRYNNRVFLLLSVTLIVCFSGLRSKNVGIDTIGYYNDFYLIEHGGYVFSKDIFFLIISKFLMNIFHSPYSIIFIYSLIINVLIILRLWDYRRSCSFFLMQFMYISLFYFESMNIMRQFLAISIIFYATRFLERKKYKLYIILNVLAAAFHLTAILGIVVLLVYLIVEAKYDRKIQIKLFILLIPALSIFAYIGSTYISRYNSYFESTTIDIGLMPLYQLLCFGLIFVFSGNRKTGVYSENIYGEYYERDTCVMFLFFLSIIFVSLGMIFRYVERIGLYFQMFEMPFWGQAVNTVRNKSFIRFLAFIFLLYYFVTMLIFNGQGIFPYTWFWQ